LDGGVGSSVEVAGGDIGDSCAPVCGAFWGGVSGLQPTKATNTMNTNNGVLKHFEETAMFYLLMTAWTTTTRILRQRSQL
jgi:hypothetical protein